MIAQAERGRMAETAVTVQTGGGLFPSSPRVFFAKAPLVQVSCGLRFPTILRIDSDVPTTAAFQEKIRAIFPLYQKSANVALPQLIQAPAALHPAPAVQIPQQPFVLPPELLQLVAGIVGSSHQFRTEDGRVTLTLATGSLSLTTTAYRDWTTFRSQLLPPLAALKEIYAPSFFTRVGLRYVDAINREDLGVADKAWSELLKPWLLGELAEPLFERNSHVVRRQVMIRMPDGTGTVHLRHGFGTIAGKPGQTYVIDFDFSNEPKVEVADAESILNRFNHLAGNAFRWCLSPVLYDALSPTAA